jgi:hypothetical protein
LPAAEILRAVREGIGTENPDIRRMHHGEIVDVSGVAMVGEVGRTTVLNSIDDYRDELRASQQENERLRV